MIGISMGKPNAKILIGLFIIVLLLNGISLYSNYCEKTRMTWTDKLPRKTGWYWCKRTGIGHAHKELVFVYVGAEVAVLENGKFIGVTYGDSWSTEPVLEPSNGEIKDADDR